MYCDFKISEHSSGVITLMADNNKFWSRIHHGGTHPVEAAKTTTDEY